MNLEGTATRVDLIPSPLAVPASVAVPALVAIPVPVVIPVPFLALVVAKTATAMVIDEADADSEQRGLAFVWPDRGGASGTAFLLGIAETFCWVRQSGCCCRFWQA
jgi:hypothetical protein